MSFVTAALVLKGILFSQRRATTHASDLLSFNFRIINFFVLERFDQFLDFCSVSELLHVEFPSILGQTPFVLKPDDLVLIVHWLPLILGSCRVRILTFARALNLLLLDGIQVMEQICFSHLYYNNKRLLIETKLLRITLIISQKHKNI